MSCCRCGAAEETLHKPGCSFVQGVRSEPRSWGKATFTHYDLGESGLMRDCLLELAGEPEGSETVAELVARVRETIKRPTQIVMQLLEELEPEEIAGVAVGIQSFGAEEDTPQERIAAALEELAAHGSGEQSEPLCYKHKPLAECAAGGGDCKGCDELKPGGPGLRGAEIRAEIRAASGTGWFERKPAARGTMAEQLWRACDEWECGRGRYMTDSPGELIKLSERLAAIIRQIREQPARLFAQTDIAQVVGRLVAVEAAVFDSPSGADKRGWEYIASEEHKAVEEAAVILAKLAPGLGNVSLKALAEEVQRRFEHRPVSAQLWERCVAWTKSHGAGNVAQAYQDAKRLHEAVAEAQKRSPRYVPESVLTDAHSLNDFADALGIEHWEQPGELVAAVEELVAAHHKLVRKIATIARDIAGVVKTPAKEWKKRGLHHHLAAIGQDLKSACED